MQRTNTTSSSSSFPANSGTARSVRTCGRETATSRALPVTSYLVPITRYRENNFCCFGSLDTTLRSGLTIGQAIELRFGPPATVGSSLARPANANDTAQLSKRMPDHSPWSNPMRVSEHPLIVPSLLDSVSPACENEKSFRDEQSSDERSSQDELPSVAVTARSRARDIKDRDQTATGVRNATQRVRNTMSNHHMMSNHQNSSSQLTAGTYVPDAPARRGIKSRHASLLSGRIA